MSAVQSTVLKLKKPVGGVVVELPATITSRSAASITVEHPFTQGDVDRPGVYKVYPVHTLAVGVVRGDVQQFTALDTFDTGGSTT
jgi:hypothetical protein